MYTNEKIYSIELGEDLTPSGPPGKQPAPDPVVTSRPRRTRKASSTVPRQESNPPADKLHFAPLMILTWLLGPFSVTLQSSPRPGIGKMTLGMIGGMAALGMVAGRGFILDMLGKGWPLWPLAAGGLAVMIAVNSVWAHTAWRACRDHQMPRHKLPGLLRRPWAIGVVGLVAPGLGLLLAGCARRGAAVIWSLLPASSAALILLHGLRIWDLNQASGEASAPARLLEWIFILAAGVLGISLVGWVAQALEGARQMMGEPGIRHRLRGDWYAAALVFALLGMAVVWDPSVMARQMDSGAVLLQEKGFQILPLQLWRGAHELDPAPSEYAVSAMEMHRELGQTDKALQLRQELDGNLASYLALVNTENKVRPGIIATGRTPEREYQVLIDLLYDKNRSPRSYQAR